MKQIKTNCSRCNKVFNREDMELIGQELYCTNCLDCS